MSRSKEYRKGIRVLFDKSLDKTIKVVAIFGLIWGISAIYDIISGWGTVPLERLLWLFGGVILVAVFVGSFALYTYTFCKNAKQGKVIKLRSTEERISDLEHDVNMIMSQSINGQDAIKMIKVEYESGKTETYTKTTGTKEGGKA